MNLASRKKRQYVLASMTTCSSNNERIFHYVLRDGKLGNQDGGKCRNLEL